VSSTTAIANLAAVRIGTDARVTSLDDDRYLARTLKAVWDIERIATIREGTWNFAMTREALAAEGGDPPYPYAYRYPLPARCLRLVEVIDRTPDSYQLEGGKILCDFAGPLYVRFLVDIDEPAYWDGMFVEAFAARLAWKCGKRIAGSGFNESNAWEEYMQALAKAKTVDARENPSIEQGESSWVEARLCPGMNSSVGCR
jgi:hypothetical protein